MKVLLFHHSLNELEDGIDKGLPGGERLLILLAKTLKLLNFQVEIYVGSCNDKSYLDIPIIVDENIRSGSMSGSFEVLQSKIKDSELIIIINSMNWKYHNQRACEKILETSNSFNKRVISWIFDWRDQNDNSLVEFCGKASQHKYLFLSKSRLSEFQDRNPQTWKQIKKNSDLLEPCVEIQQVNYSRDANNKLVFVIPSRVARNKNILTNIFIARNIGSYLNRPIEIHITGMVDNKKESNKIYNEKVLQSIGGLRNSDVEIIIHRGLLREEYQNLVNMADIGLCVFDDEGFCIAAAEMLFVGKPIIISCNKALIDLSRNRMPVVNLNDEMVSSNSSVVVDVKEILSTIKNVSEHNADIIENIKNNYSACVFESKVKRMLLEQ